MSIPSPAGAKGRTEKRESAESLRAGEKFFSTDGVSLSPEGRGWGEEFTLTAKDGALSLPACGRGYHPYCGSIRRRSAARSMLPVLPRVDRSRASARCGSLSVHGRPP